ncbi:MAG: PASTA domain-containing protein [bacterium]|nr:PASTA domain-containing protein [bacterium]
MISFYKYKQRILNIIIFFILFVCFIFISDFFIGKIVHWQPEVTVPLVENLTLLEAEIELSKVKLVPKIDSKIYSRKVSSGSVVSQYPAAKSIVRSTKIIKLVISKGNESIEVPNVLGMPQRVAEITLKNNGAIIGQEEYIYSLVIKAGAIAKQSPNGGSLAGKGSIVNLKISKGEPSGDIKLMPKVEGLFLEKAEDIFTDHQLDFQITYQLMEEEDKQDIVLSQMPEYDVILTKKQKIKIIVGTHVSQH